MVSETFSKAGGQFQRTSKWLPFYESSKQQEQEVTPMQQRSEDKAMKKARELSQFTAPKTDPMGSWTGQPLDPYEIPVQDADDL